ncbi:MAG TPA: 3'(2'),5'-bisphosphate nucleotidase [Phycisphaerales bacterium]|nr:3'(2'),5'-bisphosphate nucleotidase [Phycisphaerales bacterium]
MSQPDRLSVARLAVLRASRLCRRLQADLARLGSMTKGDASPVTVADFAAQAVVAHTLREMLGPPTIVAEESALELRRRRAEGDPGLIDAVLSAVRTEWADATAEGVLEAIDLGAAEPLPSGGGRGDWSGFWALDPIDGTKGFLRNGQYAVALAWIEAGSPTLGVLGCPALSKDFNRPLDEPDPRGTIYFGVAGGGVYETGAEDEREAPVRVRRLEPAEGEPVRLCESVEGSHTSHDRAEKVMERLGELAEPLRLDGQTKYAVAARGQADVYLRLPRPGSRYTERIWDHAAGALLAREAGLAVTDVDGRELDFSRGRGLDKNRGVVVAPARLHGLLLGAIRALGED